MTRPADIMSFTFASACLVCGVVLGILLRALFGRLAQRAASTTSQWDDLWWNMLRQIALPATAITGAWWATNILRLEEPVRGFVERVLLAAIVLTVSFTIAQFAANMVRSVALSRSGVARSASIFVLLTRGTIVGVGVMVLLQSIGISVAPLLTALGVGGLAVALALQETLRNLFAGIQILASKKVQPGDFVRLDTGEEGYVDDINWRNTTVRQLSGNIVIVPNAHLADTVMTNYHQPVEETSVTVKVGVSYDSDLDEVERITLEVARDVQRTVPGAVPDFEPLIRFNTFGELRIDFSVILRASEPSAQYLIVHEFIKRLHRRYREENIEIPYKPYESLPPAEEAKQERPELTAAR
ncbi:mechanosensitive ion channel protein [Thermopolyspora flexuosa]|uniref:Small-conductance mechanosensitive channel n=1 Tax=Thermopolyspora flexuosa TaxID=103836 RepID=A0A543J0L3_9ACTN|nr:mechanosensitive ion channel family protein [Thermopolyspora flexuosa]TQM76359.1 small-conductance mechanosensitive channel [Thermopolyspora flexuosa]GGM66764.1 mechanosensitive ion channel protein [Thermopolyspora flexuosa]